MRIGTFVQEDHGTEEERRLVARADIVLDGYGGSLEWDGVRLRWDNQCGGTAHRALTVVATRENLRDIAALFTKWADERDRWLGE